MWGSTGETAHHACAFGRFEEVTDWSALGDAVVARGHSRGDVLHLPELDDQRLPEPARSEPADFGGGESTGVQEL